MKLYEKYSEVNYFSIVVFGILWVAYSTGVFWLRIFGVGFCIKNSKKTHIYFSERRKKPLLGKYYISYLPKDIYK